MVWDVDKLGNVLMEDVDGADPSRPQGSGGGGGGGSSGASGDVFAYLEEQGILVKVMTPVFDEFEVPGRYSYTYPTGWDARAHSMTAIAGPGEFVASIEGSPETMQSGIIIGFTDSPQPSGYADIKHGFYIPKYTGFNGGTPPNIDEIHHFNGQDIGDSFGTFNDFYVPGDDNIFEFSVARTGRGEIVYRIAGFEVRREPATAGLLWGSVALYRGGTHVSAPSMSVEGRGEVFGIMSGVEAIGGSVAYAQIIGTMTGLTASGSSVGRGAVSALMSGLLASGDYRTGVGSAQGEMTGLWAQGLQLDVVPPYAEVNQQLNGLWAYGIGGPTPMGSVEATMSGLEAIGSHSATYGYLSGVMSGVQAFGANLWPDDQVNIVSFAEVYAPMAGLSLSFVLLDATANVVCVIDADVILQALIESGATASDSHDLSMVLLAMIESAMAAGDAPFSLQDGMTVWALNTELNGATRYTQWDFNSFAKIGQRYYGAKRDGLYLLEGDDDDGTAVPSLVDFGRQSFNTLSRKAMPYVYAGVASDGKLVLKVTAEGQTYTYAMRNSTPGQQTHRFELGRGLSASFYDVSLIGDGRVFDVSDIEFFPLEMKRRL